MKKRAGPWPLFVFLLPIFFVFHGFVENYRFIPFTDCLLLMGAYIIAALALYGLFYWFLRDRIKAAIAASFAMVFYLFFGYLHDLLRSHDIFLRRYSILLPVILALIVLFALYLRRKPPFTRLSVFLTILFTAYLLFDGLTLVWKAAGKATAGVSAAPLLSGKYKRCDSCPHPDIYLLLFDAYAGNRALREQYHYDNSGLDSFLRSEGFHIQENSRSNYSMTPFSMASMLNMSYLKGIPHPLALGPDDYTNIFDPIRKNEAVNFLISQGYAIVNNSPFDLPEHPAQVDQTFIPVKTKLITYRTLTDYLVRDVGGWLHDRLHTSHWLLESSISESYRMNELFLARTGEESRRRSGSPRFIYAHIMMPHEPLLFDSLLHRRTEKEVASPDNLAKPDHYLAYLPYTNSRIRKLITDIKKGSGGKAVILFMSDHGYRFAPDQIPRPDFFSDQNAVYYPDGDYSRLYDSISNVNQFRVVFNKLFQLNLPLLKDSIIFLVDKQ